MFIQIWFISSLPLSFKNRKIWSYSVSLLPAELTCFQLAICCKHWLMATLWSNLGSILELIIVLNLGRMLCRAMYVLGLALRLWFYRGASHQILHQYLANTRAATSPKAAVAWTLRKQSREAGDILYLGVKLMQNKLLTTTIFSVLMELKMR